MEAGALRHLDLDLRHLDLDMDYRFATAVAPRTRAGQEHQARSTRSPAYASQEQRRLEARPAPVPVTTAQHQHGLNYDSSAAVLAAAGFESDHVLASAVEPSAARKAAGWGHAALAALTAGSLFSVSRGAAYPRRDASGQAQPAPPAPCAGDMLATCAGGISHAADMRWRSPFDGPAAKPDDARRVLRELAAAQQTPRARRDGGRGAQFIHRPGAARFIHQSGAAPRAGRPRAPVQRARGGVSDALRPALGRGLR